MLKVGLTGGIGFGGCNVESSSYGLTCCAERVALFNAIAKGHKNFKSLAVSTENGGILAISALRKRRINSSVFPENMLPQITSIQPEFMGVNVISCKYQFFLLYNC